MATLPEFTRNGVGERVMRFGVEHLQSNKVDVLWCNARMSAEPFYTKVGFGAFEESFEIEGIGPHKLLYYLFRRK